MNGELETGRLAPHLLAWLGLEAAETFKDSLEEIASQAIGILAEGDGPPLDAEEFEALPEQPTLSLADHEGAGRDSDDYHRSTSPDWERGAEAGTEHSIFEALMAAEEQGNKAGIANAARELGKLAAERGEFDSARSLYYKSLAAATEEHAAVPPLLYRELGSLEMKRGDFEEARRWYFESLRVAHHHGSPYDIATGSYELGMLSTAQRDLEAAAKWHEEALAVAEKLALQEPIAKASYELGHLAHVRGELTLAAKWLIRSAVAAMSLLRSARAFNQGEREALRLPDAFEAFRRLLADAPDHVASTLQQRWETAGLPPLQMHRF